MSISSSCRAKIKLCRERTELLEEIVNVNEWIIMTYNVQHQETSNQANYNLRKAVQIKYELLTENIQNLNQRYEVDIRVVIVG